ncbi:hypothetical protein GNF78_16910, partial [Clostridium perfringens]
KNIRLEQSPFYINTELAPFDGSEPLKCGVSSFGFSGTNCHVVMEEYADPASETPVQEKGQDLVFALSAKTEGSLRELLQRYVNHLDLYPHQTLADICYTAGTGRAHLEHRIALVCQTREQLSRKLSDLLADAGQEGVYRGVY